MTIDHHPRIKQYQKQNPSADFDSWLAAAHPDCVTITLDARLLIPDNPWLLAYKEATVDDNINNSNKSRRRSPAAAAANNKEPTPALIHSVAAMAQRGFGRLLVNLANEVEPVAKPLLQQDQPLIASKIHKRPRHHDVNQDALHTPLLAVQECTRDCHQLVRDHLQEFLQMFPGASYESWIATLHPENATIGILPGNEEEVSKNRHQFRKWKEEQHSQPHHHHHHQQQKRLLPTKTATADNSSISTKRPSSSSNHHGRRGGLRIQVVAPQA